MGNFFKKIPTEKFDENLVTFLKTKKLQDINDTIDYINDSYPTSSTLTLDEYYDVFGNLLENRTEQVFTQLENSHNIDGKVDIYESLAVVIVFCGEEFPIKLQFIFEMFDFDKSGEIEKKELVMTFQTSIRALCKLVHIEPPSLNELEHFAEKLFLALDTDKSRSISFREFSEWMSNSWELQDFLLKYAMIQTYENANRRTREHITFYTKLFEAVSGGAQVQQVDSASIKIVFAKELKYMNEQLLQQLIKILEDSSKEFAKQNQLDIQDGMIYKEPFLEIMAAWSAFDATDINYDNETSITELKFLIYAFEGDIPDIFRVQDEMKILDKDNSGQVSRQEWISYLCLNPESQGKAVFRGNLKRLFNKFDSDNSGSLSVVEIKNLIKENLREYILKFRHRSKEDQADLDGMINTLVEQIMAELNSDNEKAITWVEFKHFMEKAYSKQETLKKFLAGI